MMDGLLEEYLMLTEEIKYMSLRRDEIKEALLIKGSFATDRFVCAVQTRERTGLISLENATKLVGRAALDEMSLVQTTSYKQVSVSKKDR